MENKRNLEVLAEELASLGPVLPGSISEQYSVCGKKNCRCSAKLNPHKHGPHYQLSYSLGGKRSSMFIKKEDVEAVYNMTASYKRLRLLSTEFALESIKLSRDVSPTEAQRRIRRVLDKAKYKAIGSRPEPVKHRDLEQSRDKWKERAIRRGDMLEQNRIRFRDLEQSREKWRNEALSLRQTMVLQNKSLEENKKELIAVKEELCNLTENYVKKN